MCQRLTFFCYGVASRTGASLLAREIGNRNPNVHISPSNDLHTKSDRLQKRPQCVSIKASNRLTRTHYYFLEKGILRLRNSVISLLAFN